MFHGVYIFDADNTLWDTHSVFVGSYKTMIEVLQRYGYPLDMDAALHDIRRIDFTIAHKLRNYEYDFTMLALALIFVSQGLSPSAAAHKAIEEYASSPHREKAAWAAASFYDYQRTNPPRLFAGVKTTLKALRSLGNALILHSEGKPERVTEHLAAYNLTDMFDYYVLEPKSEHSFRKARHAGSEFYRWACGITPRHCVVVGDSPLRDIMFGHLIGAYTVMTPSEYWGPEVPDDPLQKPHYTVETMEDLLKIRIL
ncbi:MAG: HAD hydrolase-like protein [Peptococcaceae bacterium]|nr:HAD hydrolase-like protein [Peptococcaceae bacterium]